jgi:hypothetical protein
MAWFLRKSSLLEKFCKEFHENLTYTVDAEIKSQADEGTEGWTDLVFVKSP